MAENEQVPLEQLRKELTELLRKQNELAVTVEKGNRDTVELNRKMQTMQDTVTDSNREYHIIKHDVANVKNNLVGLVDILKKNDDSFKDVSKLVQSVREEIMSTQHERRLSKVEEWVEEMKEVATIDMFRKTISQVEINSEFRTKFGAWWLFLVGIATLIGIVLSIITLTEKFITH